MDCLPKNSDSNFSRFSKCPKMRRVDVAVASSSRGSLWKERQEQEAMMGQHNVPLTPTMRADLKKITSLCFTDQGREEPQRPSLTVMHLFPVSLRALYKKNQTPPDSANCPPTQLSVQAVVISRLHHGSALLPGPSLTDGPQCGSPSGLRSALKGTCHSGTYQPPLATHGRPNQIEVANSCLRSDLWVCTHLLELNHSALCSSSASMFHQGMQSNFCQVQHTRWSQSRLWIPDDRASCWVRSDKRSPAQST